MLFSLEGRLDPGDLHILGGDHRGFIAPFPLLDFTDAGEKAGLERVELRLRHLAELHLHLRVEQPFAQHGVVVHLGIDGRGDLVEDEDEDIRRLKSEISSQKGSTYFARMQYGRLIDAALQSRTERYVGEIFNALRSVSVASRSNKPIGDRMIMNAAFLVSREMEQAFDSRVKQIGQQYEKLTFKYTGPWPPYNFVNIRLKLERAH